MEKINLILSMFSTKDKKHLKQYLETNFFKIDTLVGKFLQFHLGLNQRSKTSIPKEEMWARITDSPFLDSKFRILVSRTYTELIQFIGIRKTLEKSTHLMLDALEVCLQLEINPLIKSASSKVDTKLNKHLNRDSEWIFLNYRRSLLKLRSLKLEVSRHKAKDKHLQLLDEVNSHLDNFYYTEKLKLLTTYLTWKGLVSTLELPSWATEIMKELDSSKNIHSESINIYKNAIKLISTPDDLSAYADFKLELKKSLHKFEEKEQKDILDISLNYCLRRVNNGDTSFLLEIFETFKMMINQGVLTSNGELNPWKFKNVTGVALRLKKFSWIENFIDDFGNRLPPEFRESGIALSRAQLAFYKGQFQNVLSLLQNVQFKEFGYNTTVKSLQLAAFYELDEYELLEDMSTSFKKYLRRQNRLSLNRKDHFFNLISFVKILSRIDPKNQGEIRELQHKIQTTKGLASKTWLLEKVDELLGEPKT